jgi:membrane protein YqaA with SNARE-associated domain
MEGPRRMSAGLMGLFLAAFLAATPVPFQSEVVFIALLGAGTTAAWLLVLVASAGNVLGSCVTYVMGRGVGGLRSARWFPLTPEQTARAEGWFNRWGVWVLLVSWLPGGDLAVAMAGALRVPWHVFLPLLIFAKTLRYAAVAWFGSSVFSAIPII